MYNLTVLSQLYNQLIVRKMKTGDLVRYEEAVERLASSRENFDFPNKDYSHASIVVSALVKYSHEIRLFVKNLDGSIADVQDGDNGSRFLNSLNKFLDDGKIMKMVIEEPIQGTESGIFKFLKKASLEYGNSVDIRQASDDFIKHQKDGLSIEGQSPDFYYMIGDNHSYRINFDRVNHKAVCNFNNEPVASVIVKNFDRHFSDCTKADFE